MEANNIVAMREALVKTLDAVKEFHKWCPDSKDELAFGFE